jgi:hypothetical protein
VAEMIVAVAAAAHFAVESADQSTNNFVDLIRQDRRKKREYHVSSFRLHIIN